MGDKDTPNRAANRRETEGAVPNSESSTERGYRDADGDNAGGITNRPLDEEVENQNALPDRGLSQADERVRNNEDMEQ